MKMTESLEIDNISIEQNKQQEQYDGDLYKKWFHAGSTAGFISIKPFTKDGTFVGKFIIDIGSVDPKTNQIQSSTKCYVDAVDLVTFLRHVDQGSALSTYPKRKGVFSPESFATYGGSAGEKPISRIFKIEYWGAKANNEGNSSGFAWKCGHFAGIVGSNGQITPDTSKVISTDYIRISRLEMAEIYTRLNLAMISTAANDQRWYESK